MATAVANPVDTTGQPAQQNVPLDPWATIAQQYGLGAPPAPGLPATLPGVTVGAPPQLNTNPGQFNDYTNMINSQINGAYGYNTPQAATSLIPQGSVPQPTAQQVSTSPQLQAMLNGQGYSPKVLAEMHATATQQPAQAGLQQMSQMKQALSQAGLTGSGASAALEGEVARQTGQAQGQANSAVDLQNANMSNQNQQFGIGQQTQIGTSNMQAANQMALANANMMFQSLTQNQQAQNSNNQLNTTISAQQKAAGAQASSGFLANQGQQATQNANTNQQQNNANQWQGQQQQTAYDWQKQTMPWQELNTRYGQAQNILGNTATANGG